MKGQKTIGIVGGGQLGRMLALAAFPLGFKVVVVDPTDNCPAKQVGAEQIKASLKDKKALKKLADKSDYITFEIEHIDASAFKNLKKPVNPAPQTMELIQDKFKQKQFLQKNNLPVGDFVEIKSFSQAQATLNYFGGSMILKTRRNAYDGRGNAVIKNIMQLEKAFNDFGQAELYAEKLVGFKKELAAVIAKDMKGNIKAFPLVETIHERNICVETLSPARVKNSVEKKALSIASEAISKLKGSGVYAVEMFLTIDGKILINEIAPRVHNSGHYTMDACATSQFEQHIRAVTNLPLGDASMGSNAACMVNILGKKNGEPDLSGVEDALSTPDIHIHMYGKSPNKVDRKMGHINAVGSSLNNVRKNAKLARNKLNI